MNLEDIMGRAVLSALTPPSLASDRRNDGRCEPGR